MIISNIKIVSSANVIEKATIKISGKKIEYVGNYNNEKSDIEVSDGDIMIPGFIDQHTHGGYGFDVMDANAEGLKKFISNAAQEGITSILPTTMTMPKDEIIKALENISNTETLGSKIVGIHLEGPFINNDYKGAQNDKNIIKSDESLVDEFLRANKDCKIVTYAPENADDKFSKYLLDKNMIPSIGHSNATMQQVKAEVDKGVHTITHLHNAHSNYHHRTPGILNAALAYDEIFTEIICDGIHVHPEVVKSTKKIKGADKMILITDSMKAKGLKPGKYDLGGQGVVVDESSARLEDGTLAGSVLKMDQAFRNYINFTNCSLLDATRAAATNVAHNLGLKEIGDIKVGYFADLLVLDRELNVKCVIIDGEVVYVV